MFVTHVDLLHGRHSSDVASVHSNTISLQSQKWWKTFQEGDQGGKGFGRGSNAVVDVLGVVWQARRQPRQGGVVQRG